jgi:hypothetical protein
MESDPVYDAQMNRDFRNGLLSNRDDYPGVNIGDHGWWEIAWTDAPLVMSSFDTTLDEMEYVASPQPLLWAPLDSLTEAQKRDVENHFLGSGTTIMVVDMYSMDVLWEWTDPAEFEEIEDAPARKASASRVKIYRNRQKAEKWTWPRGLPSRS